MRNAGVGLLLLGAIVSLLGMVAGDAGFAVIGAITGGAMFVAGAVFAAGAGVQDAIRRR